MILDDKLTKEYENLFDTLEIQPGWQDDVDRDVASMTRNKARYEVLAAEFNKLHNCEVPWFMIGLIHKKECSFKFTEHLHNGDDLKARTVNVPKGRPVAGSPPFTFEFSAMDALEHDKIHLVTKFDVPGCIYFLEKYNGWGYREGYKGFHTTPPGRSPYLWAGSQHWKKGKFVKDGKFDREASSKNLGAAVLMKSLHSTGLIVLPQALANA